jgi:hypothetical protein
MTTTCKSCGSVIATTQTTPSNGCARCGQRGRNIAVAFSDTNSGRDELELIALNKKGDISAERISKQDSNTSASAAADAGQPMKINVMRQARVHGFDEESIAVKSLIAPFNARNASRYTVREKKEEDSDYADRELISDHDQPSINVQVRHLDEMMIAGLGKTTRFDGLRSPAEFVDSIEKAIKVKASIDPVLRKQTVLLLIVPAALGQMMKRDLQLIRFDSRGFREVWIASFREPAFCIA